LAAKIIAEGTGDRAAKTIKSSDAGLQFADEGDAEQKLPAFRHTYEPFLNGLADYLVLPLPDWLPAGGGLDKLAKQSSWNDGQAVN
jgi:hypothetical protein